MVSDDCYLRPLLESDADELYALIEANRDHLRTWMPWADQGREATVAFLRAAQRQAQANNGAQFALIADERIAGVIGVHWIKWAHGTTSFGYWIDEDAQGRGLVTRSVAVLLDHAFDTWGLHRVEIRAAPENHRSRAIPDRLGFSEEGLLRDNERIGDRFVDHVVYSMLASEWRTRNGEAGEATE